ncbi:fluoride efflux transporter CrcB [Rhodovulum sp. DZ06]|uniref:fluoride efflux transporter CrcB n=1 Tax=Rhodovulum sp. DZ06 TaxID=3425126 RepID=UPI003D34872C
MTLLSVALGGALGASLRYLTGRAAIRLLGPDFPWGTVAVNVVGSFAMGLLAVAMMERFPGAWGRFAPFAMTGLLGGFTTFSAFSLDALSLWEKGRAAAAALYVGGSVTASILALALGLALGRAMFGAAA